MAVTNTPIYPQNVYSTPVQIVPGTGTSYLTVATGGANAGTKFENIIISNSDPSNAYTVTFAFSGTTPFVLCTINIPASAGYLTSSHAIGLMQSANLPLSYDMSGNKFFYLGSGIVLQAKVSVAVATSQAVNIIPLAAGTF